MPRILKAKIEAAADVVATADALDADNAKRASRSVIAATYKKVHVMDAMATKMSLLVRGGDANAPIDPKLFGQLCRANGIPGNRWEGKNIGMQFMNLSNVLHNRAKRGEDVTIALAEPKKRGPKKVAVPVMPVVEAEQVAQAAE